MKIGVLGGGQLGRMLALAGHPIGLECVCFDASPDACAGQVGELVVGEITDVAAVDAWAKGVDVITYEFETFPPEVVGHLAAGNDVIPNAHALATAQDRWYEKRMFGELDIPVPPFRLANTREEIISACSELETPLVVKSRTGGYDGKSQVRVRRHDEASLEEAIGLLEHGGVVVEQFIDFHFEVSVIGVRGANGDVAIYPVTQNNHRDGILRTSITKRRSKLPRLSGTWQLSRIESIAKPPISPFISVI